MSDRPLGDVLRAPLGDFSPSTRSAAVAAADSSTRVEHAYTGNVAVVRLERAGRVELHGLDRPSYEQDWDCPEDWTPAELGRRPP